MPKEQRDTEDESDGAAQGGHPPLLTETDQDNAIVNPSRPRRKLSAENRLSGRPRAPAAQIEGWNDRLWTDPEDTKLNAQQWQTIDGTARKPIVGTTTWSGTTSLIIVVVAAVLVVVVAAMLLLSRGRGQGLHLPRRPADTPA